MKSSVNWLERKCWGGNMTDLSTNTRQRVIREAFQRKLPMWRVKQKWGPVKPAREIHRVIPWDAVSEAEGTGIVHIAPGCGKEDFALGKEKGLVPIAPLDEAGVFLKGFGELTGRSALDSSTIDW